jgi:hypothetical protein
VRRLALGLALLTFAFSAVAADATAAGKAKGTFVVSGKPHPLNAAYVVEKTKLLRVVLATEPLEPKEVFDEKALQAAVEARGISALVIHLDEERRADATFFFDPKLPAGLEVRELGSFKAASSKGRTLSGSVAMEDDGFSFSYKATFEAPIVAQPETAAPLAADATPAEAARHRLEQMEIDYDYSTFRGAVLDGKAEIVKLFLDAGMPVESQEALALAVEGGKTDVVKLLLERGANANAKDAYGQSLVMRAASAHQAEALRLLIAAGADVNVRNDYRIAPLAVAAEQGQLEIVKILLAAGAKVNARDTSGGTALSVCILRGYADCVRTLLDAGTDVQRDKEDLLALAAGKPEIKAMLEKAIQATKPRK